MADKKNDDRDLAFLMEFMEQFKSCAVAGTLTLYLTYDKLIPFSIVGDFDLVLDGMQMVYARGWLKERGFKEEKFDKEADYDFDYRYSKEGHRGIDLGRIDEVPPMDLDKLLMYKIDRNKKKDHAQVEYALGKITQILNSKK